MEADTCGKQAGGRGRVGGGRAGRQGVGGWVGRRFGCPATKACEQLAAQDAARFVSAR